MAKARAKAKSKAQGSPDLCGFLTRLATEPETLSAYRRDPAKVMAAAKLPQEAREALASGDPLRIHRLVAPSPAPENEPVPDSGEPPPAEPVVARGPTASDWLQSYQLQSYLWWMWANSRNPPSSSGSGSS